MKIRALLIKYDLGFTISNEWSIDLLLVLARGATGPKSLDQ